MPRNGRFAAASPSMSTTTSATSTTTAAGADTFPTPADFDYAFIEITGPTPDLFHPLLGRRPGTSDYTFSRPGGGRLPGLQSGTFKITTVEERARQAELFAGTRAVLLRDMDETAESEGAACDAAAIMALFPNVDTVLRSSMYTPLPHHVPTLVDACVLTELDDGRDAWGIKPELHVLGPGALLCNWPTNTNGNASKKTDKNSKSNKNANAKGNDPYGTLDKHVIQIEFHANHPLLPQADIDLELLGDASTAELVLLFTPAPTPTGIRPPPPMRHTPKNRPCGMLHSLIPHFAEARTAVVYTLVGTEHIPPAALGATATGAYGVQERILTAVRLAKDRINASKKHGTKSKMKNKAKTLKNAETADGRDPASYVRFVTVEEYAARVGAHQFMVETFGAE